MENGKYYDHPWEFVTYNDGALQSTFATKGLATQQSAYRDLLKCGINDFTRDLPTQLYDLFTYIEESASLPTKHNCEFFEKRKN